MRAIGHVVLVWAVLATVVAAYNIQENNQLKKEIRDLNLELKGYVNSNENVLRKNQELWNNIAKLEEENKNLKIRIRTLEQEKRELEQEIQQLRSKIDILNGIIEEFKKVPEGYYSTDFFPEHGNSVEELRNLLKYEFELPHEYVKGVFDCSEIAAYTEWVLEDAGFDAYIAEGYYTGKGGAAVGHAWVIVKIGSQQFYIDPTVMRKDDDRTILIPPDGYKVKPSAVYGNIFEAIEHDLSIDEWDWWNVVGFPPKN